MKSRTIFALSTLLMLTGCQKSCAVNYNLRNDANNFKVRRKVVALNTQTDETLFSVEGYISIDTDSDGDLNVMIRTGEDEYKLFYAHLSDDVTYTSIQLEPRETNQYAYEISFFPAKEAIMHGLIDINSTEEKENER